MNDMSLLLVLEKVGKDVLDVGINSIGGVNTRNGVDLAILVVVLDDGVRSLGEDTEALLDGLDVIVGAAARLAALHQAPQHDFFGALEVQCELAWHDLLVRFLWREVLGVSLWLAYD